MCPRRSAPSRWSQARAESANRRPRSAGGDTNKAHSCSKTQPAGDIVDNSTNAAHRSARGRPQHRSSEGNTAMRRSGEKLRLGAFFNPTGHHVASWRHPQSQADAGINFEHYVEIARTAERAKMDMVFLADNISVRAAHPEALARSAQYIANMEPITLLSALAAVTTRIGLVATASTDHISKGRAGWNLVTSGQAADAYNFSRDEHYEHGVRYDRAREFAEVVVGLWDSWDDDAFIRDKQSGIFLDPSKAHRL